MANTVANTAANTAANNFVDIIDDSGDNPEIIVDTSDVESTPGSLGDVYGTDVIVPGTEFTGIEQNQLIGTDGPIEPDSSYEVINGVDDAIQNVPDRRFHPQPVQSAPGTAYKNQQAPVGLSSAGVPLLGNLFNSVAQNVSKSQQSGSALPASRDGSAGGQVRSKSNTRKTSNDSGAKAKENGKVSCRAPRSIDINDNKTSVRIRCENAKGYKDFPLLGGDSTKKVGKDVVQTGIYAFKYQCCYNDSTKSKKVHVKYAGANAVTKEALKKYFLEEKLRI